MRCMKKNAIRIKNLSKICVTLTPCLIHDQAERLNLLTWRILLCPRCDFFRMGSYQINQCSQSPVIRRIHESSSIFA
jgi:hypothetical protein